MKHLMFNHVGVLSEGLLAHWTLIRLQTCVKHLMFDHVGMLRECFLTHWTFVGFESIMHQIVPLQVGQLCETLIANLAYKWTVASVGLGVLPHGTMAGEFFATDLTLKLVFSQMLGAMLLHLLHRIEALSALRAFDLVQID